jgi:hypothetical protein
MGAIFRRVEPLLKDTIGFFVEIGTSRNGDDGSTKIIASWAKQLDRVFFSVDMDPKWTELAILSVDYDKFHPVNSTGEKFLRDFPSHTNYIGFLYLDNFDWDWHPDNSEDFVIEQQQRYRDLGVEMNNVNCQRAHLRQAQLALSAMAPKSIVVCDDTWFNPNWGVYTGKSGAAVTFLLNEGFKVLETEAHPVYGTILTRGF